MRISYNWLQRYFDSPLPAPEKLSEFFTAHVFEVEEMRKAGDDTVFDFKTLPDRNHYLLSHRGVAREVKAIVGLEMKASAPEKTPSAGASSVKVNIKNDKLCRRYVAREMNSVEIGPSPDWLRVFIESIGQRSINSVVDTGNFIMFDVGQPMHVFDADKLKGDISVRLAKNGEKIVIFSGAEVALLESDLVVADDEGPIAIAGVKGGKRAEVTASTTRIIIESANFEPSTVRKTSTRLNLRNESSKRFENEITPALAGEAMDRMAALVKQLSPGASAKTEVDVYPSPAREWEVVFSGQEISLFIGMDIPVEFIVTTLSRMDCRVERAGDSFKVVPPLDRYDLAIPQDIADEVARIWGYDKLQGKLAPALLEALPPDKTFFYSEKIKNVLVPLGYSEVLLYSLVKKGIYEISYPLAEDKAALRERLSDKLAEVLVSNARNAELLNLENLKLFEIGKVFPKSGEKTSFALGVSQIKKNKSSTAEGILKTDIDSLRTALGANFDCEIKKGEYGAACEIDIDAIVSKLPDQQALRALGFKSLPKDKKYQKFSVYPFIVRDIAMFVPENVDEKQVQQTIEKNAGPLCVQIKLFDVFTKDFPEGKKKSFAFRLIFQSFERTLTEAEVNAQMNRIYVALKDEGAEIR